jgi:hypothetical protein
MNLKKGVHFNWRVPVHYGASIFLLKSTFLGQLPVAVCIQFPVLKNSPHFLIHLQFRILQNSTETPFVYTETWREWLVIWLFYTAESTTDTM